MDKWFKNRRKKRPKMQKQPVQDFHDLLNNMTYNSKNHTDDE